MKTFHFNLHSSSANFDDIIFENRNKVYGAYDLRSHYQQRLIKALIITIFFSIFLSLFVYMMSHRRVNINYDSSTTPRVTIITEAPPTIAKPPSHPPVVHRTKIKDPSFIVDSSADNPNVDTSTLKAMSAAGNTSSLVEGQDSAVAGTSPSTVDFPVTNIKDSVVDNPDIFPAFPGGSKALTKYLQNHLNYSTLPPNTSGRIYLRFIITMDGNISSVEILSDEIGYGKMAKRAVELMPAWLPGKNNGVPVNVRVILPIYIRPTE